MSLARILGKPKGRQSFISDSRWVLPSSFIGVEVEYEGVKERNLPKHTFADFWTYHEEGSLKDNGAEYVFTDPLFGLDARNALEWLILYAKDSGWKCTKRTGIHVHIDVRDLSVPQLAGMSILYAALEPILYHWVGDGRDVSHFCIPLYRADDALLGACSILRSAFQDDKEDGHNALSRSEEFQRYAGLNLQALAKFGSIEFRHLQTTHDLDRIRDWINMIMSLKASAFKLPQSDGAVVRMIQRMGIQELLYYVFPPELAVKLYTKDSEREFTSIGLVSARDVAVQGCGNISWIPNDFPRGEHKGFLKWIKSKTPKNTVEEAQHEWLPPEVDPEEEENLFIPELRAEGVNINMALQEFIPPPRPLNVRRGAFLQPGFPDVPFPRMAAPPIARNPRRR